MREPMTTKPPDRLKAILESETERWAETRQVVESNARAIATNSDTAARQWARREQASSIWSA